MAAKNLTLVEVQQLIANKPLALVNLEHSQHNKKIVIKALNKLWQQQAGHETFEVLRTFLKEVAPNYDLDSNQDGVRLFLLREMAKASQPEKPRRKGLFAEMAGMFGLASS